MREYAAFTIALLVLSSSAYAGTVTLTGSCPNRVLGGAALFNLTNSGNDTAADVTIVPHIPGAHTASASYSVASLPPSSFRSSSTCRS